MTENKLFSNVLGTNCLHHLVTIGFVIIDKSKRLERVAICCYLRLRGREQQEPVGVNARKLKSMKTYRSGVLNDAFDFNKCSSIACYYLDDVS